MDLTPDRVQGAQPAQRTEETERLSADAEKRIVEILSKLEISKDHPLTFFVRDPKQTVTVNGRQVAMFVPGEVTTLEEARWVAKIIIDGVRDGTIKEGDWGVFDRHTTTLWLAKTALDQIGADFRVPVVTAENKFAALMQAGINVLGAIEEVVLNEIEGVVESLEDTDITDAEAEIAEEAPEKPKEESRPQRTPADTTNVRVSTTSLTDRIAPIRTAATEFILQLFQATNAILAESMAERRKVQAAEKRDEAAKRQVKTTEMERSERRAEIASNEAEKVSEKTSETRTKAKAVDTTQDLQQNRDLRDFEVPDLPSQRGEQEDRSEDR